MEVGKKVGHCVGNARLYGDLPLLYGALYGDLPLFLRARLPISCKNCLSYKKHTAHCLNTLEPNFSMLGPSLIILALGAFISNEASEAVVSST